MADVAQALAMVMAAHGRSMDEGRIKTVALLVADQGWKRAELMQAARILASDPKVRDHLRYGGTISPADFEELRRPQERREHDPDTGDVTIITTRTGFALKVAKAKLYTHAEAFGMWKAAGEPGVFSDARSREDGTLVEHAGAMFTIVESEGQTYWRFK